MPRFSGANAPSPELTKVLPLFAQANYKFSTNESGRPSTFYFQDMVGARGRYRRGHGQGSQLIFQGRCRRLFVSPLLKTQLGSLTTGGVFEDNLNHETYGKFMTKLTEILEMLEGRTDTKGTYSGRASLKFTAGWHVFDTDGNNAHCSAGTILQADPDPTPFFAHGGFLAYTGAWSIW